MNLDAESENMDECYVTASQIFDCCGIASDGSIRVNTFINKFAPFVKTNKAEYSYLKSLLDPEQNNPEIDVTKLAWAVTKYSENPKAKVDLEESFNLNRSGQGPLDSDSGISTDGFQLLEELQCELREKAHQLQKLRSQLDFTDKQHEETVAALTAERDKLRTHLAMLREENMEFINLRRDYEEMCERLCGSDQALSESRQNLDILKKKMKILHEQVGTLENEKLTLQDLLTSSKAECHRINEMYATRQSALIEENETLKREHANLTVKLQDQEEFMQQTFKEKVLLEMELKDVLNKSNQTNVRLDRSVDVSMTEEQMLTALDSLNTDSRFAPEYHVMDEESFVSALKEDIGRPTNLSLFDEMRLSFSNMSKINNSDFFGNSECHKCREHFDKSFISVGVQTCSRYNESYYNNNNDFNCKDCTKINVKSYLGIMDSQTQTLPSFIKNYNNRKDTCLDCLQLTNDKYNLQRDLQKSQTTILELGKNFDKYEDSLCLLQNCVDAENGKSKLLEAVVNSLKSKISLLESACAENKGKMDCSTFTTCDAQCQSVIDVATISTQADVACVECEKRKHIEPHSGVRKFLLEPLKGLFQLFAVVCFICAILVLYGVTKRWHTRCSRDLPWRWFDIQDIMDMLLRIEYVADVPM